MKIQYIFVFLFAIASVMVLSGCVAPEPEKNSTKQFSAANIPKFNSCSEIKKAFGENNGRTNYMYLERSIGTAIMPSMASVSAGDSKSVPQYSETNVQVAGVDEADFVKTDGRYIYIISNGKLHIAEAYPAESAKLISSTDMEGMYPQEIFIEGDRLLVFGMVSGPPDYGLTKLALWDISSREKPKLLKTAEFEGEYVSSRKINSTAYFVIREYAHDMPAIAEDIVPQYREYQASGSEGSGTGFKNVATCNEIGYLTPLRAESFIIAGAMQMDEPDAQITKEVVVGSGANIYASSQNLYVAEQQYDYGPMPIPLPFVSQAISDSYGPEEKTIVHKFSLDGLSISYLGSMEAPGTVLNQFSMDEYDGYFRIATTDGHVSRNGGNSRNNVYTFDSELKMQGKLEGLAPGERIYSARFMGNRAYLVTFKKVDPLFVISLSDQSNPEVLGKLKIPGYSDYLHPIDENHIIGIGKDTVEAEEGNFAWYQGVKMAVFDVSDVSKPKEMHKVIIGDRGTDSYALQDHKAFLYDKEKNLLVIPILLAEVQNEYEEAGSKAAGSRTSSMPAYGDYVFQGAYVYNLTLDGGFKLRGRITHIDNPREFDKYGYYYDYGSGNSIKRSIYIGDALYTISDNRIQANSLDDLRTVRYINLFGD